jgi:integration host factor subunit alpha
MSSKTLTRADLVVAAMRDSNLSRREVSLLLKSMLSILTRELEMGEPVKISSFGSFNVNLKRKRVGRNPKTGEPAIISARRVVTFKASRTLKDLVNRSGETSHQRKHTPTHQPAPQSAHISQP